MIIVIIYGRVINENTLKINFTLYIINKEVNRIIVEVVEDQVNLIPYLLFVLD